MLAACCVMTLAALQNAATTANTTVRTIPPNAPSFPRRAQGPTLTHQH
jgi:hypothetical protein